MKEILRENDSFFRTNRLRLTKRTGHYAWPCHSFLEVIAFVIILIFVGLAALQVLVVALRMIVALIVSMTMAELAIIAIALVTLMVVAILVAAMLPVSKFTAMRGRKMSRVLLFQLLLVLGNLLENALTLLEESNKLDWVSRHHLVQVRELELMCLGLRKEDLFTLLLCCGYFNVSTEVATLEIAEKLHSMLHELVHRHESGLLGRTKPANPLVAYIEKIGDSLEVIRDTFVKACPRMICIAWTSICNDAGPFGQAYILKALTNEVEQ
jgi:hypothetical protein